MLATASPTSSPGNRSPERAAQIARWRAEPDAFCEDVCGLVPWDRQRDLLRAVRDHNFVAVRSGHKVSKTCSAAVAAFWWAATRPSGRAILTSTSKEQLKAALWPEFRGLWRRAVERGFRIGEEPALDPATGWRLSEFRGVFSRTTDKAERLAGISGSSQFYIVDEASGYPEELLQAMTGNLAGGGKMLLIGNPTQTSGAFYDAFHDKQHLWHTLHIRSTETPNFHGGNVSGLANPVWLERMRYEWGEDSPLWDVRVLGEFPRSAPDAVVSLVLVEAAKMRHDPGAFAKSTERLHLGVDAARGGNDRSVIQPRRGCALDRATSLQGKDTDDGPKLAQAVMQIARDLRRDSEKPIVKIDTIGVGAAAFDALKPFAREIDLVGVNVSERADDDEHYHNLRTQLHFAVRDWLKDGGQLPPGDTILHGELVAAKFKFDARGRYQVEGKDEIKARLKRSPDSSDALALAVYAKASTGGDYLPDLVEYQSPIASW